MDHKMQIFRWSLKLLLLFSIGCITIQVDATVVKAAPVSVELTIEFSFSEEHRCSRRSPEIKVSGLPAGTNYFLVELKKVWTGAIRGEWEVNYDGFGTIPAGSLKSGYFGPCPPKGSGLMYQFTVKAVGEDDVIIGIGKAAESFSPIKYNPVANPAKLQISFADPEWNGEQVPTGQQCQKFGGHNPSTPSLIIKGIPSGTNTIIMEYSDRSFPMMDHGGHGRIGYRIPPNMKEAVIPSVPGHTFDLPEGFFILSPHQAPNWDKAGAYQPPCSGGNGNSYYVTVNAVYRGASEGIEVKLLGQAIIELGRY